MYIKDIEKASKQFFEAINIQISDALEEGQIMALPTSREGLKAFHFTCPFCKERKTADHMVRVVKPLRIEEEKKVESLVVKLVQEQLLCCDVCADKNFEAAEGGNSV